MWFVLQGCLAFMVWIEFLGLVLDCGVFCA